jgi:hypothetical protein
VSKEITIEEIAEAADDPLNRHSLARWTRDEDERIDAVRRVVFASFEHVREYIEAIPPLPEAMDPRDFFEAGGFLVEGFIRPAFEFILEHAKLEPSKDRVTGKLVTDKAALRAREVRVVTHARFADEVAALRAFYEHAALPPSGSVSATARAFERYRLGVVDLSGGRTGVAEPHIDPHVEKVRQALAAICTWYEDGEQMCRMLRATYVELESARERMDTFSTRAGGWSAIAAASAVQEWVQNPDKRADRTCPMPASSKLDYAQVSAAAFVAEAMGMLDAWRWCTACGGKGVYQSLQASCVYCKGMRGHLHRADARRAKSIINSVRKRTTYARFLLRELLRSVVLDVRLYRVIPEETVRHSYELPLHEDVQAKAQAASSERSDETCCAGWEVVAGARTVCRETTVRGPKYAHPSHAWARCSACGRPLVPVRRRAASG